ncbi:hypothetical protein [Flavobacterium sp.]|uniref:hypothetical protein n=1 Tax=Flavobacterium sp. TaxID=239 RepID=UPI003D6B3754
MAPKKYTRKSNPIFLDRLPEGAKELILKKNLVLNKNNNGTAKLSKYTKQRYIQFYDGYDILQNLIVTRQYIQKRYEIDYHLFELLLFLFPMQYFTREDYQIAPRQFRYRGVKHLMELGHVVIAVSGENRGKHLYKLSRSAQEIVKHTYHCLSGEKKIPESYQVNPMAKNTANSLEKRSMDLIKKLNQQEVPATKKKLFL